MNVRDIMYTTLYRIKSSATVAQAAMELKKQTIGALLVQEEHKDIGIVTDRDIVRKVVAAGKDPNDVLVKDIMSAPMVTVGKDHDIQDVIDLFIKHNIKRVPVVYAGDVVGIVSTRLVAKYIKRILEE